jgi:hypothetical protein
MNRPELPSFNSRTPWGSADSATHYGAGVILYSTPSHGGFWLSEARRAALCPEVRAFVSPYHKSPGWFEEDCEWALVALSFPFLFTADELATARRTAASCYPELFKALQSAPATDLFQEAAI